MNIKNITLLSFLLVIFTSCYSDKGNYDYIELNDFEIKLSPTPPETFIYVVNQPSGDTLSFTIKADVNQTLKKDDSNLEYFWTSTIGAQVDSVFTSEITLQIPPDKASYYNLMCRVRDTDTNIEYYQDVAVKTEVPYHDAWLLLYGDMGDRRIGAIQWDAKGNPRWDDDIMTSSRRPQLKNAKDIAYTCNGTVLQGDWLRTERLFIAKDPDTIVSYLPFDVKLSKIPWDVTRPVANPDFKIAKMIPHGKKEHVGLLDENGKFYWARAGDFFYAALSDDVPDYQVDCFYTNDVGVATLWDNKAKNFMFYKMGDNQYSQWNGGSRQDNANTTQIAICEDIEEGEMDNRVVLWAGRGVASVKETETSLFVVKDQVTDSCYLYDFVYNAKGGQSRTSTPISPKSYEYDLMQLTRDTLQNVTFTDNAVFATSNAFNEQLFYSNNSELYRLIVGTEEVIPVLSFDGRIKTMRFRISNNFGLPDAAQLNLRTLAIVIEGANGKDDFKEVTFDTAGDIIKVVDYDYDFGKIEKIDFTATIRRFDL